MKRAGKTFVILLVVMVTLVLGATTAFAATGEQEGVSVTLTTDKKSYTTGETATINIRVTNTNSHSVSGVKIDLTLPGRLSLQSGAGHIDVGTLAAGETKEYTVTATATAAATSAKSPKTADDTPLAPWIILMAAAAAVAAGVLAYKKKALPKKLFVVLLSLVVALGAVVPGGAALAAASTKTFTVAEGISVDGENGSVSATVTVPVQDSLAGGYAVSLSGTVDGTSVTGMAYLGIKDTNGTLSVNAISLYVSENGWGDNTVQTLSANAVHALAVGPTQALSIYGGGDVATLNADGGFSFKSNRGSVAGLNGTNLLPNGNINVSGGINRNNLNLNINGNLGEGGADVRLTGTGQKTTDTTPGIGELPTPPAIQPSLAGRYDGSLAGSLAGTSVTGNVYLGIGDINGTPSINAVSLFASEKGWANGAEHAISVYGGGNLAAVDGQGKAAFRADLSSPAKMDAHGIGEGGYVDITVTTDGSYVTINITGSTDGTSNDIALSGTMSKTSTTTPELGDLPVPPAIVQPVPVVSPDVIADAVYNVAYWQTFTASGGTAPYTFTVTGGSLRRDFH